MVSSTPWPHFTPGKDPITNISSTKYDVMYVDICCSTDSMTCGSPVQISLYSVSTSVSLFYGLHSMFAIFLPTWRSLLPRRLCWTDKFQKFFVFSILQKFEQLAMKCTELRGEYVE